MKSKRYLKFIILSIIIAQFLCIAGNGLLHFGHKEMHNNNGQAPHECQFDKNHQLAYSEFASKKIAYTKTIKIKYASRISNKLRHTDLHNEIITKINFGQPPTAEQSLAERHSSTVLII